MRGWQWSNGIVARVILTKIIEGKTTDNRRQQEAEEGGKWIKYHARRRQRNPPLVGVCRCSVSSRDVAIIVGVVAPRPIARRGTCLTVGYLVVRVPMCPSASPWRVRALGAVTRFWLRSTGARWEHAAFGRGPARRLRGRTRLKERSHIGRNTRERGHGAFAAVPAPAPSHLDAAPVTHQLGWSWRRGKRAGLAFGCMEHDRGKSQDVTCIRYVLRKD